MALSGARGANDTADIRVEAEGDRRLRISLVLTEDTAGSQVTRGENAGRALTHVAVAYAIQNVKAGGTVHVRLHPGAARIIALVRDPATNRIVGAARIRL